jgi:hypothetical protein
VHRGVHESVDVEVTYRQRHMGRTGIAIYQNLAAIADGVPIEVSGRLGRIVIDAGCVIHLFSYPFSY